MAADLVNSVLMAAVGHIVTRERAQWSGETWPHLLLDQTFTANDLLLIREAQIRYFVVDDRLTRACPHEGCTSHQGNANARSD